VILVQAALAMGVLVAIALIVFLLRWRRARRPATEGGTT
jgi:hypothetical protein